MIAALVCAAHLALAQEVEPLSGQEEAAVVPAGDRWQQVISEEGRFRVEMPALPTFKTRTREYAVGEIEENSYELETKDGVFAVEYTDLPRIVLMFGRGIIYRMAKRNFLRENHAREVDCADFDLGPFEGRELLFKVEDEGKAPARAGVARFVLAGKRLYVVMAEAKGKTMDVGSMGFFLDSFEIVAGVSGRRMHKYREMQQETLSPETLPAKIAPKSVVPPDELITK